MTAPKPAWRLSASSRPTPSNSQETRAATPSNCSTTTQTSCQAEKSLPQADSAAVSTGTVPAPPSISSACAGQACTHRAHPTHFSCAMTGAPAASMTMASAGQLCRQRSPHPMHFPGNSRATPRFFVMIVRHSHQKGIAAIRAPVNAASADPPPLPDHGDHHPAFPPVSAPEKRSV